MEHGQEMYKLISESLFFRAKPKTSYWINILILSNFYVGNKQTVHFVHTHTFWFALPTFTFSSPYKINAWHVLRQPYKSLLCTIILFSLDLAFLPGVKSSAFCSLRDFKWGWGSFRSAQILLSVKLPRLDLFGVAGGRVVPGVLGGEGGSPSGRGRPGAARRH